MTTPVLITGGTGLLGLAVVANFRATHDHAVVLAPTRQDLDLFDGDAVREWFRTNTPSTVVHAAGHVRGLAANMGDQLTGLLANARMSLNLLGASAAYPPNRLVVASSNAAYAYPFAELPLHEDALLYGDVHPGEYGYAWGHRTLIAGTTILKRHHGIQTSVAPCSPTCLDQAIALMGMPRTWCQRSSRGAWPLWMMALTRWSCGEAPTPPATSCIQRTRRMRWWQSFRHPPRHPS